MESIRVHSRRRVILSLLVISLLIFSTGFSSAGWLSDLWAKVIRGGNSEEVYLSPKVYDSTNWAQLALPHSGTVLTDSFIAFDAISSSEGIFMDVDELDFTVSVEEDISCPVYYYFRYLDASKSKVDSVILSSKKMTGAVKQSSRKVVDVVFIKTDKKCSNKISLSSVNLYGNVITNLVSLDNGEYMLGDGKTKVVKDLGYYPLSLNNLQDISKIEINAQRTVDGGACNVYLSYIYTDEIQSSLVQVGGFDDIVAKTKTLNFNSRKDKVVKGIKVYTKDEKPGVSCVDNLKLNFVNVTYQKNYSTSIDTNIVLKSGKNVYETDPFSYLELDFAEDSNVKAVELSLERVKGTTNCPIYSRYVSSSGSLAPQLSLGNIKSGELTITKLDTGVYSNVYSGIRFYTSTNANCAENIIVRSVRVLGPLVN